MFNRSGSHEKTRRCPVCVGAPCGAANGKLTCKTADAASSRLRGHGVAGVVPGVSPGALGRPEPIGASFRSLTGTTHSDDWIAWIMDARPLCRGSDLPPAPFLLRAPPRLPRPSYTRLSAHPRSRVLRPSRSSCDHTRLIIRSRKGSL